MLNRWVYCLGHVLANAHNVHLTNKGVKEGIISFPSGLVIWLLSIRLDAVFQAGDALTHSSYMVTMG